jgi:adenine/guanine phosphoribosyltransferase-like PRPP-binding protein
VGGKVAGFGFVIELGDLNGSTKLKKLGHRVESLVIYD